MASHLDHHRVGPGARRCDEQGMSLIELLVSLAIMSVLMSGVFAAMIQAVRANESVRLTTSMNNNLRVAMDLLVRDLIQVGQGLPAGRVVTIPSGTGALPILRPGPIGAVYTFDPASTTLPAVTVGPQMGPVINGQPTDMVTILAADNVVDRVQLIALDATSMTLPPGIINDDLPDADGDNIRVGDLIMFTKQSISTLRYVTAVNAGVVRFDNGAGDLLNLNQIGTPNGTMAQYVAAAPLEVAACPVDDPPPCALPVVPSQATRIRMISYYLETPGNNQRDLRLIRRINANPPTVVAFFVERFALTYDLVNGAVNPVNVAMTAADLDGTGACAPAQCSVNQVRKINISLTARSSERHPQTRLFFRNTLSTQVSLRNLSLVDRYS